MDLNRLNDLTDKELMMWYYEAQEMRISEYIKAIKNEMNKRSKEL